MNHDPQQLIDAYIDETLTPEQGAALNDWVKRSPDNARRFAKATWLHRQVYDRLHVADLRQMQDAHDKAKEVDYGQVLQQLAALEASAGDSGIVDLTDEMARRDKEHKRQAARLAATQRAARNAGGASEVARVIVIPKLLVYGVAAMVALGLLTALYAGWMTGRKNLAPPVAHNPGTDAQGQTLPPVVAELVRGDGLVWGDRALSSQPGTELRKGGLVLERGIAEVRFQSGAVATFRGPAVIDLRGDNRVTLIEGTMVARVPEDAYGFTVNTPTMRVVDLGTEFGVTADLTGDSAVQVFAGEVTAAIFDIQGELGRSVSFVAREGVAVDAQTRSTREIEVDGRAFADLAPHVAMLYRNLVVNGDFEAGEPGWVTGDTFPDVENMQVLGWEDAGPGTVLRYDAAAAHDYPDPAVHAVPEGCGQQYYLGMAEGLIRQRIDVADLAGLIDADAVTFDLSAWLGGFMENDEYIQLTVRFLDGRGRPITDPVLLDPVRAADRRGVSGFLQRADTGRVPSGTRSIVIELENIGEANPPYVRDGYADNVSLVLSAE